MGTCICLLDNVPFYQDDYQYEIGKSWTVNESIAKHAVEYVKNNLSTWLNFASMDILQASLGNGWQMINLGLKGK